MQATRSAWTRSLRRAGVIAFKIAVTGACFWYVSRQISLADTVRLARTLDIGWAVLATFVLALQVPLVGLRWSRILAGLGWKVPRGDVVAITAIGVFFGQVLPNIAGDAMRVWLLMRLGPNWRQGVISVLIDRAVGILTLLILSFAVLLFPSALAALGGHRDVIASVFGSIIAVSILGLVCTPYLAAILERWQGTRMIGTLARATFQVLLRRRFGISIFGLAFAVHGLAMVAVSLLGRAQGLILPPLDAAVLFALMVAVSIIPISIGGWGLRELAVVSLLQSHGIEPERALFFSVCFGLALIVASLPGAVIWAFYSREPNAVRKSLRK